MASGGLCVEIAIRRFGRFGKNKLAVLLHEAAVYWIRKYLKEHAVKLVRYSDKRGSMFENKRRVSAVLVKIVTIKQ